MRPRTSPLSFADLERQDLSRLDPVLQSVSGFLDQHAELVQLVLDDLQKGLKKPNRGRAGITPSQVLRSLVLMRVKDWDYRELRERIADGISLRRFTAFDSNPVPQHDAFNRAFTRLTPSTLGAINHAVIQAAVALGLEDGKKLRVDTTVVETNIHYPTDATLLWDTVRTLDRLLKSLRKKVPGRLPQYSSRARSARRRMQEIQRMTAQQRSQQQTPTYRKLIGVTRHTVDVAGRLVKTAQKKLARNKTPLSIVEEAGIRQLCKEVEQYRELGQQVIDQARRRVLEREQVPTEEKLYSIFEPHTEVIKRGKSQKPVEFGRKVFLAESAQGLITDYRVLKGNPADSDHVPSSLERHRQTFQCAPELYASDRGFHSADNVKACEDAGVSQVCIPQRGGHKSEEQTELERTRAFKQGQRFRAGIEGRISVLFRGRGMKRCRSKGPARFEVLVGAAVLANNLLRIAQLLKQKKTARQKPPPARPAAA